MDLKRARNSVGEVPTARAKARSIRRREPNPLFRATRSILSPVSSNQRRARSIRTRSTKSAGLTLRLPRKRRLSERSETPASKASSSARHVFAGLCRYFLRQALDLGVAGRLCRKLGRKLALSAGPNTKDDVAAGDGERDGTAMVGFDHGKRQVHARCDAGRCPHPVVLDVNGVAIDLDRRDETFSAPRRHSNGWWHGGHRERRPPLKRRRRCKRRRSSATRPTALATMRVMVAARAGCGRLRFRRPPIRVWVRASLPWLTCLNAMSATSCTPEEVAKGPTSGRGDFEAVGAMAKRVVGAREHLQRARNV